MKGSASGSNQTVSVVGRFRHKELCAVRKMGALNGAWKVLLLKVPVIKFVQVRVLTFLPVADSAYTCWRFAPVMDKPPGRSYRRFVNQRNRILVGGRIPVIVGIVRRHLRAHGVADELVRVFDVLGVSRGSPRRQSRSWQFEERRIPVRSLRSLATRGNYLGSRFFGTCHCVETIRTPAGDRDTEFFLGMRW